MIASSHDKGLIAGVCARLADRFGWNVWAIRVLFVAFALVKTLWAIGAYVLGVVLFHLLDGTASGRETDDQNLRSPELSDRQRRIDDLERQFRDLERSRESRGN